MKVVLFCGGLGTRIREYSENIPKPMVPVGNYPILMHLMQYYSRYGHRDFVLCLGYKANIIKEYFLNYKPQNPLYLMLVRAYRLAEPVTVENTPAYAGCKSWVPLDEPIAVVGATPAIDDAAYERRRGAILDRINAGAR